MDSPKFNIQKDWTPIEVTISEVWPEKWSQANPLEIKSIEEMIENRESLDTKLATFSGGMCCDFSASLENLYYLFAIMSFLQDFLGLESEEIKRKLKIAIGACSQKMQVFYKEVILPKLDYLIFLMKEKK